MSESVIYSDVKFNKKRAENHEPSSPNSLYAEVKKGTPKATSACSSQSNDVTYSTVSIAVAPRETGASSHTNEEVTYSEVRRGPQQKPPSQGISNVTKRVVIGILIVVLVLVVIAVVIGVHMKERKEALTTTPNTTAMISSTTTTYTTTTSGPCLTKLHCDTGWELNGTKCYYFSENKLSWNQSEEECINMGGHLVKIESREEQMFLSGRFRNLNIEGDDKFWIGLTDSETEDVWKWTDGSLLDQNLKFWFVTTSPPEPDNWTGDNSEGEDCVRMGEKGADFDTKCWFDKDCDSSQRYICEKNANCKIQLKKL